MSRRTKFSGFTLVELLVVISIIGMLVSMLLPAVQAAREAGRRNTCLNNMNQTAFAALNFESNRRRFPGYVEKVGAVTTAGSGGAVSKTGKRASWVVTLFPYMERSDLYTRWDNGADTSAAGPLSTGRPTSLVESLICPSDFDGSTGEAPLSFVANCGIPDATGSTTLDLAANGIFHDHFLWNDNAPEHSVVKVTVDYLTAADGTSNTVLLSENLQATSWAIPGGSATTVDSTEFEPMLGFIWQDVNLSTTAPTASWLINGDKDNGSVTMPNYNYARPSSNHPGGVNTAFADRSSKFINQNIDYVVYQQIMTCKGTASSMDAAATHIYNAEDLQ